MGPVVPLARGLRLFFLLLMLTPIYSQVSQLFSYLHASRVECIHLSSLP
jgi:hypothetical protein